MRHQHRKKGIRLARRRARINTRDRVVARGNGPRCGQRILRAVKIASYGAAIIGTITAVVDTLHRW
jgi:hypothetical protein